MYLQRIGILSQTQVPAARPAYCTKMDAANLMGAADNTFNPYGFTDRAFTVCYWQKMMSTEATYSYGCGRETSSANRSFQPYYFNSAPTVAFLTDSNTTLSVTTPTNPSKNKWYFLAFTATEVAGGVRKDAQFYDENGWIASGTSTSYTMVNNNNYRLTVNTARYASGQVGGKTYMQSFGFWNTYKNKAFTDTIWNSGNGLSYSNLDSTQKTGLVEWFDMNDWNGTQLTGNHAAKTLVKGTYGGTGISRELR